MASAKTLTAFDFLGNPAKHPPRAVCVLFGDEAFLKRLVLHEIRTAVLGDDAAEAELSLASFIGDEAKFRDIMDELSTVALFGGGQRLVIVYEADDFVSEHRQALEDYVAKPKSTGTLLLELKTFAATTRLYKAAVETGLVIDFRAPDRGAEAAAWSDRLVKWLVERANTVHQTRLQIPAVERLMDMLGNEVGLLDAEIAKLALIAGAGNAITLELVEKHGGGWRAKTGWEMIDRTFDGKPADALVQLDRLLLAGEQPIALLGQLGFRLRQFAAATRLIEQAEKEHQRLSPRDALATAGVKTWPGAMQPAERQLRQLGRERCRHIYRWLLEADLALKGQSSSPQRARAVLEQLIVRLAANKPQN